VWTVEKAWLVEEVSHQDEVDRLAFRGQRLLSPEEWEYACGAGASTLFRWGDVQPSGRPHMAVSGPHLLTNAFGLDIGQNPFQDERTADPDAVRGGDGGRMACGNLGDFVEWLTLATAFRDPYYEAWLKEPGNSVDKMMVRAAIPIG
jgi:formylglycine-generating enzyme required for sulfatase activity